MFFSQEAIERIMVKLKFDPERRYTSDEILETYGKGLYLIHFSLQENYPKISSFLKRKNILNKYCVEVFSNLSQMQENVKSWWEHIEEDFIYTYPRQEFLDLDTLEEGYVTSLTYCNKDLFNPSILEILSGVQSSLWESLYNTEDGKNNPQMVIDNMKKYAFCLQEGIGIAEIREKSYDDMIKDGIYHDLANEEAAVYAYNLTQEIVHYEKG